MEMTPSTEATNVPSVSARQDPDIGPQDRHRYNPPLRRDRTAPVSSSVPSIRQDPTNPAGSGTAAGVLVGPPRASAGTVDSVAVPQALRVRAPSTTGRVRRLTVRRIGVTGLPLVRCS